jgi:hypothetical protein
MAGDRINLGRRQQADLVVVPQGPDGHPAEPGELSDAEHDTEHARLTQRESQALRMPTMIATWTGSLKWSCGATAARSCAAKTGRRLAAGSRPPIAE